MYCRGYKLVGNNNQVKKVIELHGHWYKWHMFTCVPRVCSLHTKRA